VLQLAVAAASSVGCGASLRRGVCGLYGGGATCHGSARSTTLEVVCGATHVGSGFPGGRHRAYDIVDISLGGV
jgi:hypothetical protein